MQFISFYLHIPRELSQYGREMFVVDEHCPEGPGGRINVYIH